MNKNFAIAVVLCMVMCATVKAQMDEGSIRLLAQRVEAFNKSFPQEHVYLHLDNNGYFIGEMMWYKAYVVSSDADGWTDKSRVLYVELVDPKGEVVKSSKLEIKDGQANGEFALADLYEGGFYEVRAYTRYMTNWGKDCVFSRILPIFKRPATDGDYSKHVVTTDRKGKALPTSRESDGTEWKSVNAHLYPEGGSLVQGIRSRVAYDVTGADGMGIDATGMILCEGDTVCRFATERDGRGMFDYTPDGRKAVARICDADGHYRDVALPEAKAEGCVLEVNAIDTDVVNIAVRASAAMRGRLFGLYIGYHGRMISLYDVKVDDLTAGWNTKIAKRALHDGVNELYLFDAEGQVLANRMVFVYPNRMVECIKAELDDEYIAPYQRMDMTLTTLPNTTFSLAVRDADAQTGGTSQDVATWLLLGSELKGYIAHPDYYLESDDMTHRRATDLLMMVQGWRCYDFELMSRDGGFVLKQPMEKGLLLDGKLYPRRKKHCVANVDLDLLLRKSKSPNIRGSIVTDADGHYSFVVPDCYDTYDMVMRTSIDDRNVRYYIGVDRWFAPDLRPVSMAEILPVAFDAPNVALSDYAGDSADVSPDKEAIMIEDVNVKAKRYRTSRASWEREAYAANKSMMRYSCGSDEEALADRGLPMPSLLQWLKGKNALLRGNDNISGVSPYYNNSYNYHGDGPSYDNKPVRWFLDNRLMFVTSAPARFVKAPPEDREHDYALTTFPVSIDEVKSVYISDQATKGYVLDNTPMVSIYVYSRYGGAVDRRLKGMRFTHFEGYKTPQRFVSPNYSLMSEEADYRRTLYWNPNVTTDATGKAVVTFYNSTRCSQIVVSAEGVTREGKAVMTER